MSLSAIQRSPTRPSRDIGLGTAPATLDISCCLEFLSVRATVITPAGPGDAVVVSSPDIGFPQRGDGSAPARRVFGACSTFTRVAARTFAESLFTTLLRPRLPTDSLPPPPFGLLPADATSHRVGIAPTELPNLFTTHSTDLHRLTQI